MKNVEKVERGERDADQRDAVDRLLGYHQREYLPLLVKMEQSVWERASIITNEENRMVDVCQQGFQELFANEWDACQLGLDKLEGNY